MITPFLILWLTTAAQADKALELFGQGQAALEQKKYAEAAQLMQSALPPAEAITDPAQKQAALAAIHFFSGLAYIQANQEMKAKEQIELFLVQMPKSTSIDKGQYPQPFVDAFAAVVKAVRANASPEFDARYPGYRLFSTEAARQVSPALWNDSPEYRYLATAEEQARWKAATTDDARAAVIAEFWARRDPTPDTAENEFRTTFDARVAFADRTFGSAFAERGALSDRGRLFVILGRPRQLLLDDLATVGRVAAVGATAQEEREAAGLGTAGPTPRDLRDSAGVTRAGVGRQSEAWGYEREQVPVRIRDRSILFRMTNDVNQDFKLPPSAEYTRVLLGAAEKAIR